MTQTERRTTTYHQGPWQNALLIQISTIILFQTNLKILIFIIIYRVPGHACGHASLAQYGGQRTTVESPSIMWITDTQLQVARFAQLMPLKH